MNVKKAIKNVVSLGMGVTMVGSTIMGAMAATLSDYPAPFTSSGEFNALLVIGAASKPSDMIGVTDIATSLQFATKKSVSGSTTTASVSEGERLDLSSNRINLQQGFQKDTLTKSDMDILDNPNFEDEAGTAYGYDQYIKLGPAAGAKFKYEKYDTDYDPELGMLLSTTTPTGDGTTEAYRIEVAMTKTLDIADNANVEGESIELLGREYTIGSESDSDTLVLYGSSMEYTLAKAEEATVTSDGVEYTVGIIGFSQSGGTDQVVIEVNGVTGTVNEGQSKKIGGLEVFGKTISSWDNQAEGVATLQLGSDKLTFEHNQEVQKGESEEDIEGTKVSFTSTDLNTFTGFTLYVYAGDSDTDFWKLGESFVDPVFETFKIDLPSAYNGLDASRDEITLIRSGDTRATLKVTDLNGNEKEFDWAYSATTGATIDLKDENQKTIHILEGATAAVDEFIFLPAGDAKYTHLVKVKNIRADNDSTADDYVQFQDVFSGDTYKTSEFSFIADDANDWDSSEYTSLTVDGKTYRVFLAEADGTDPDDTTTEANLRVRVVYDDDSDGTYQLANAGTMTGDTDDYYVIYPEIELEGGEQFALTDVLTSLAIANNQKLRTPTGDITFVNATTVDGNNLPTGSTINYIFDVTEATAVLNGIKLNISGIGAQTEPALLLVEEEDEDNAKNCVVIETKDASNYLSFQSPKFSDTNALSGVTTEDSDVTEFIDTWGTFISKDVSGTNGDVAYDISYPNGQMYLEAFLTPIGATVSTSTSGGLSEVVAIDAGATKLDSEVSDYMAQNLIVVGGPCVNTVAASLMGNPANCAEGFEEGKAMIKLFNHDNGKVALLVAGYSATDTRAACIWLHDYADHSSTLAQADASGEMIELAVASLNSVTPTVKTASTE